MKGNRIFMQEVGSADTLYTCPEGYRMQREEGCTPGGNPINGRWVLRDPSGQWIDFDQYRNDLAERHNLELARADELTLSRR